MNKFIFSLALMAFSAFANAQVISNLDEAALIGTWEVQNHAGVWENIGFRWPKKFEFNDGKKSFFYAKGNRESHQTIFDCGGYWIGGSATGRYTLHLIQYKEYGMDIPGISMLNFIIKSFDGETLIIETFDGEGIATFIKKDSSGISGVPMDMEVKDTKIYNLNGVEVENPSHGIYIQGGEKILYP